jgi:hypothetical protein
MMPTHWDGYDDLSSPPEMSEADKWAKIYIPAARLIFKHIADDDVQPKYKIIETVAGELGVSTDYVADIYWHCVAKGYLTGSGEIGPRLVLTPSEEHVD